MRGATSRAELPRTILKLLDTVWPVLRAQRVLTGHNVVIYFGGLAHIEAGVEVFSDFVDVGDVLHSQTPAGPAVTTAHWGDYSEMAGAYAALERWCVANGRRQTGTSWEVRLGRRSQGAPNRYLRRPDRGQRFDDGLLTL